MNPRLLPLLAALSAPAWAQTPGDAGAEPPRTEATTPGAASPAPAGAPPAPAASAAAPARAGSAGAAPAPSSARVDLTPSADSPPQRGSEPNVRLTVIEERGKRIEELRVRGQLTRISVRPLDGGAGYEFLPERDLRDDAEGRSGSQTAVGKRVWRVLAF